MALVKSAGRRVLDIRDAGLDVMHKSDDSPVTQADLASETILSAGLSNLSPGVPIISEERDIPAYETRRAWPAVWLVDPLDGTREFVEGRADFTINIAFVVAGKPLLGIIYQPVDGRIVVAYQSEVEGETGGWVCFSQLNAGVKTDLIGQQASSSNIGVLRVLVSRHHGDLDIQYLPETLRQRYVQIEQIRVGSALKFCLLATAEADFYVRNAPTCEWDTAAGQVILEAVGGGVCDFSGQPFAYNTRKSLKNVGFYGFGFQLGATARDWL